MKAKNVKRISKWYGDGVYCSIVHAKFFFLSPSTKIYFSISGSNKKISGMAVSLWFHVASFRHQQHQKIVHSLLCIHIFVTSIVETLLLWILEANLMWKLSEMKRKLGKVWKFQEKVKVWEIKNHFKKINFSRKNKNKINSKKRCLRKLP